MNKDGCSPADWAAWLRAEGQNAAWRIYGDPARPPDQVPEDNYEGWFLQSHEVFATTIGGLFFFSCHEEGAGFVLSIQRDEAPEELWAAMQRVIGRFAKLEVSSGNCRFSRQEWLERVERL